MRHRKLNKRLGRNKSQRKQLLRSIVRGLFLSYKIETTFAKAKEARKLADKIIKYAKSGTLKDIRVIESIMQDRALTSKIVKVLAPLSKDRKGGYARVIKLNFRRGDGAQMAILELTDLPVKEEQGKKAKKKQKLKTADIKVSTKSDVDRTDQEADQPIDKTKADIVRKADKPKVDQKKEKPEAKIYKKPEKEKSKPGKKGMLGKFRGFFKRSKNQ